TSPSLTMRTMSSLLYLLITVPPEKQKRQAEPHDMTPLPYLPEILLLRHDRVKVFMKVLTLFHA
ncbi:MAG: hypothetical protein K6E42_00060, partial [Synergistes sp.]|nr:hypothetical protein [Synergistes sp.]